VLWLWKLTDLENPRGFTARSPTIDGLAYGPDGRLVTDGGNNALAILDVDDAGNSSLLPGHTGPINDIAFRPDGGAVASASSDGTIRVWSFGDPAHPAVLAGHAGPVTSVAFSADGAVLASAGQDGAVLLWDLNVSGGPSSRALATVPVAADVHPRMAFSPVGRVLAVPTSQGPVRTWDLGAVTGGGSSPSGSPSSGTVAGTERVFAGHQGAAAAVAFNADGTRLASGGLDHSVRIWDLRPDDIVNRLCADPASHLTEQESSKYFPGIDVDLPCG
jgi:WD40 repeat protein